jgi:hypothetical protein
MTGSITATVSNTSALTVNGAPGWSVTFTSNGAGSTPAFQITQTWNAGSYSSSTTGTQTNYAVINADYNAQSPSFGFNAYTTLSAPGNNICNFKVNGIPCSVSTPDTASITC